VIGDFYPLKGTASTFSGSVSRPRRKILRICAQIRQEATRWKPTFSQSNKGKDPVDPGSTPVRMSHAPYQQEPTGCMPCTTQPPALTITCDGAAITPNGGLAAFLGLLAKWTVLHDLPEPKGCTRGRVQRRTRGCHDGSRVLEISLRTIIGCDRVADGERLEADSALTRRVRRFAPASGSVPKSRSERGPSCSASGGAGSFPNHDRGWARFSLCDLRNSMTPPPARRGTPGPRPS